MTMTATTTITATATARATTMTTTLLTNSSFIILCFFKALMSLRELTPTQIHINQVTSMNEAKAEPIWYSWLFNSNDVHDTWRR